MINKVLYSLLFAIVISISSCASKSLLMDEKKTKELKDLGDLGGPIEISKEIPATDKNIVATPEPVKEVSNLKPTVHKEIKSKKKKPVSAVVSTELKAVVPKKKSKETKSSEKNETPIVESKPVVEAPLIHEPSIEDQVGFIGRRPEIDPFHVGETVIHDVSFFKVSAGKLKLKVEPFSAVNGRKSYTFAIEITSNSMFSSFYSVDDRAETLVDYENLVPHVFSLHVKESGQMREAKSRFDHATNQAYYFEKKVTEKNGLEEKKQNWEMMPFSQNVYSAIFYMRLFKWEIGKEYSFRVAHDDENIVFRGKALRKEKLETPAGTFNTIVIKPEFTIKGAFRPVGDIFFWMSDDDRKLVLRIESHIKIGTLVSEAVQIIQ